MVGRAPAIRCVFVTFLSESRGTLKSTCEADQCLSSTGRSWTHPNEDSLVLEVDVGDSELVRERHVRLDWFNGMESKGKEV